jgi:hypothetical protein
LFVLRLHGVHTCTVDVDSVLYLHLGLSVWSEEVCAGLIVAMGQELVRAKQLAMACDARQRRESEPR